MDRPAEPTGPDVRPDDTDAGESVRDDEAGSQGASRRRRRPVSLALQGGGSHGAFTWGVLDRLLEDGRFAIEGISGTSAGAVNGALLAYGLHQGGTERARDLLGALWRRIAERALVSPFQPSWWDRMTGNPNLDASPAYAVFDAMTRLVSPYQFNPFDFNPLRDILEALLEMPALHGRTAPRLYVSATNVTEGRLHVFQGQDLSVDALLASTCLPFLFKAVEIDGRYYWDGGYMGNPTLYPLIHDCAARDILIVQINPIRRPDLPITPTAILDRINEISFNSTFMRELRSMGLINRLIEEGRVDGPACGLRPAYVHLIGAEDEMDRLTASSKLNADWGFIRDLFALGRETTSAWLDAHGADVGRRSTFDPGHVSI